MGKFTNGKFTNGKFTNQGRVPKKGGVGALVNFGGKVEVRDGDVKAAAD